MHVSILPQTPLPSRLAHHIEKISLCCTVGPCWLSILNRAEYLSVSNSLPIPHPIAGSSNHEFLLSLWGCFCFVKQVYLYPVFLDFAHKGCHKMFLLFCLTSLSVTVSRPIHVAADGMTSSFLMTEWHPIVCMYHICIHSSVDGHWCCFHILAIINSAAVNSGVSVSFQTMFFCRPCSGVGLQGHMVALFWDF